jgi:4,5:9,10-diseco-3-hydroxy-5,9,17-trioxoandrosta-1(10),2-diene-4-oate hydrolase
MSTQAPQVQYTKVGQINTRFWALGDEGSTVLLIHGIGGSLEDWMLNANALARNNCVFAVDLVGSGHSDKPSVSYTFSYLAQFVNDFMEAENIDRACLIGHSLGGGVSLQFTIQFPDKVDKLVLVNSAGLGKEGSILFRLPTLPILGELLTRPSRKGTANLLKACVHDPAVVTDELIELAYSLAVLPGAQNAFLSTVRSLGNFRGIRKDVLRSIVDNLGTITAPTLIFWGQQDRILPVAHAHVAENKIPDTQLHIFDPCGHCPQLERPEEFNSIVLKFLAD